MIQQSQKMQPFTTSYGSRGHMMLQAALGQENRLKKCDIKSETVKLLNFKKKIRRKSVNFKDPVVQSEHIYHQTTLVSETSEGIDLPPSIIDVPLIRLKRRKLKRKWHDEYEVNKKGDNDECLFSSPKIAKIIPYYQDINSETQPEKDKVELSTSLNQTKKEEQQQQQPVEPTLPQPEEQSQIPPTINKPEEIKQDKLFEKPLEPNDKFERSISNFFFNPAKWIMKFIYH